jgi:hypothetical protein
MPTLWFVVPVYGRLRLARICLRQLRRTCDSLAENGVEATAVLIGERQDLDELDGFGFATVERDNLFVSRKFNDGIQLACDPKYNPRPADYAVPIGSDDWVDWRLFLDLPPADTIVGFQRMSFVREDGREITARFLNYPGGCGIRIYPRQVVAELGYRPADEDRKRGCDTSILTNLFVHLEDSLQIVHHLSDPRQIVDWKTGDVQLNPYATLARHRRHGEDSDPFVELDGWYPDDALEDMALLYADRLVAA